MSRYLYVVNLLLVADLLYAYNIVFGSVGAQNAEKENLKKEMGARPVSRNNPSKYCKKQEIPRTVLQNASFSETVLFGPAPLQKVVGDFCCISFGGLCRGFSWRIFLGTFSHKNEEKNPARKSAKKIRRLKNKNPRKIRSAKIRP